MESSIDEFVTRGYKLKSTGDTSARLQKKDWGDAVTHIVIAGATFWWTLGLANALYAIYKRVTAEEIVIRIDDTNDDA